MQAVAPRHVYSLIVTNASSKVQKVTVLYSIPDGSAPSLVLDVPVGGSKTAEERTVQLPGQTYKQIGRITKVTLQGGNTLQEPFDGVNSPVRHYRLEITAQNTLVAK